MAEYDSLKPRTRLVWRLTRLGRLLASALDAVLADLDVSYPQYRVLVVVSGVGEASGAEIARVLNVTAPTVNGLLGNLEASGYLARRRSSGRAVPLSLTDDGHRILELADLRVDAIEQRLAGRLSLDEARVLEECLNRMADDMQGLLVPGALGVRLGFADARRDDAGRVG